MAQSTESAVWMMTDKRDGWKTIYTFPAMPLSLVLSDFVVFGVVCLPMPAPITVKGDARISCRTHGCPEILPRWSVAQRLPLCSEAGVLCCYVLRKAQTLGRKLLRGLRVFGDDLPTIPLLSQHHVFLIGVCVCVCVCVCERERERERDLYICICVYIYVYMCMLYVFMYVCIYVSMYVNIYTY
jgi:hypothetical protein